LSILDTSKRPDKTLVYLDECSGNTFNLHHVMFFLSFLEFFYGVLRTCFSIPAQDDPRARVTGARASSPKPLRIGSKEQIAMKSFAKALTTGTFSLRVAVFALLSLSAVPNLLAQANEVQFDLHLNPKFAACVGVPNGPTPVAHVTVKRGPLTDSLTLVADNIKPRLAFDMFTVQRTSLKSDGTVNPAFTNFGLAWYQTDLQANAQGHMQGSLHTILLDQIFGFDPDQSNPSPINTFNVGFWFNNPADAQACGFDVTKPTPFNGEHHAGPLAMISLPDATTNLGPLCTNPNKTTNPATCNP
jgi:hypothetical protein